MIQNGLVIVGVSIYLLVVVSGLVVIAAVAIDRFFARRREATVPWVSGVSADQCTCTVPDQSTRKERDHKRRQASPAVC